jgi:hypothetical protein
MASGEKSTPDGILMRSACPVAKILMFDPPMSITSVFFTIKLLLLVMLNFFIAYGKNSLPEDVNSFYSRNMPYVEKR